MVLRVRLRDRDERGAVAVVVAVTATALFLIAALVVDLGQARDIRRHSQNAADASALAAGNALYSASDIPDFAAAVDEAKAYAATNFHVTDADWSACSDTSPLAYIPSGSTPCISFNSDMAPTKVRVVMPTREMRTGFGVIAGVSTIGVGSDAAAALQPGTALHCGLCILGSGALHDLQNGDATVHNANIHFNGNVNVGSNGLVATDGIITVEGTATGSYANYAPDPLSGVDPIDDPMSGLPLPPSMTALSYQSGSPCTSGPGIYGAQNLRNAPCNLSPGLYVVISGTWDLAGNASTQLLGSGVTIFLTCASGTVPRACAAGETGATIDASGSGTLGITAPTSGPLQGVAIVYDRNNTATLRLTGNGSSGMSGTIYAASGTVQMNGNGCSTSYGSAMVMQNLEMNGNPSCLQSTYDQSANYQPPPSGLHLDE